MLFPVSMNFDRQIARPLIRPPKNTTCFHRIQCFVSIDSLIKLPVVTGGVVVYNSTPIIHTPYPEIFKKVKYKTRTYHGFSYNVKEKNI